MSTLNTRKIKHDSSAVDNITLDSNGNLTVAGTIAQSKAMTTQYDGIGIRMGSSTANTNRGATFLQHTYVDAGGNQGNYVYNHSLRQNDGTYIANVYTADYSAGVHSWYHPNGELSGNPVMQIDASGRVTMPYQPAFMVAGDSRAAYGPGTDFIYATTRFNVGNHYSTSTGRFTAPIQGRYAFYANSMGDSTDARFMLRIVINGTDYQQGSSSSNSTQYQDSKLFVLAQLNAGDYVYMRNVGNKSTYTFNDLEQWFCGYLVS